MKNTSHELIIAEGIWRRRQWHPTPVLLPGKSHGWRSLEGCSPWGRWGSDMTERLHFHLSLSCMEKATATHSSVLAWRIPGTGKPGRLPSMGSHRVGHDWSDLAAPAEQPLLGNKHWNLFILQPLCNTDNRLSATSKSTKCHIQRNILK